MRRSRLVAFRRSRLLPLAARRLRRLPAAATTATAAAPGQPDKVERRRHRDRRRRADLPRQGEGLLHQPQHRPTLRPRQGGAAIVPAVRQRPVPVRLQQHRLAAARPVPERADQGRHQRQQLDRRSTARTSAASWSRTTARSPAPKDLAGKKVAANTLKNIVDTIVKDVGQEGRRRPGRGQVRRAAVPRHGRRRCEAGQVDAIFVVEPFLSAAHGRRAGG